MDLQDRLDYINSKLDRFYFEGSRLNSELEVSNWVLDIEASPVNKNEVLTYSVALMCVDNDSDICYNYKTVKEALHQLFSLKSCSVNIYIHNLYYDFKPFLIEFVNSYNAKENLEEIIEKEIWNGLERKKDKVLTLERNKNDNLKDSWTYDITYKNGQLYCAKFYGEDRKYKKITVKQKLVFKDTLKIIPFSLKKASKDLINLELSKEGLDYNKKRTLDDKLTYEEKKYIYEDVFALKYIVKKLCVEGFNVNGKEVKYTKITNSSQSLVDYKLTLLEDYNNKQNLFSDDEYWNEIDTELMKTSFFKYEGKENIQSDILFKKIFPPLDYFTDSWVRNSYYGGLSMVDFENVKKYENYENKIAQVFDVNSLYPYIMLDRLLPVGRGCYVKKPYKRMSKKYKEKYLLYIQEIYIHDMDLKPNKTAFVQVKNRTDFNGRETIKENINKEGKKVSIRLFLSNPLLELLFDNYNIKSYELGHHIAYNGKYNIFKNYLTFWGEVKKNSEGLERAISKLRQNALYGKVGTNGESELVSIGVIDNKWNVENFHTNYVSDNIYLPLSSFITSYAKKYLVDSINKNRDKFLYCDTDSLHVFGELEDIKGLRIHDKEYGAWKHEMTFNDFKYLGAKRYAEKNIATGKWEIKCCGLTSDIMNSIDDIEVFDKCEYTSKELNKMKLYTKKDDVYYYKDKECTVRIKGLFKSKKAKIVKFGTSIVEQPYMLTDNPFTY